MIGLAETLVALKALESQKPLSDSLPKPPKAPFDSFGSDTRGRVSRISPDPDALAERAAVVEQGAKVPRAWAEAFARLELSGGGDLDAAGRALDAWGVIADALGWRPHELLAVALQGEVMALTAKSVALRIGETVRYIQRPRHDQA